MIPNEWQKWEWERLGWWDKLGHRVGNMLPIVGLIVAWLVAIGFVLGMINLVATLAGFPLWDHSGYTGKGGFEP